jgi:hypothetical protein
VALAPPLDPQRLGGWPGSRFGGAGALKPRGLLVGQRVGAAAHQQSHQRWQSSELAGFPAWAIDARSQTIEQFL